MAIDANNPYFRTKVLTASPEELRLMLIEGSIRFMKQGREGLVQKNYEQVFDGFCKAKEIIIELLSSMKPEYAPDLCGKVGALYTYMFNRLTEGSFEKDVAKVDEVIGLMEYERETWVLLMEKLKQERAAGSADPAASPANIPATAPNAPPPQRLAFSAQG